MNTLTGTGRTLDAWLLSHYACVVLLGGERLGTGYIEKRTTPHIHNHTLFQLQGGTM